MYVSDLMLEVTRNCTLECEHCLRGDREIKNMSPVVLDAIFKDITHVGRLLLSGGEPLLAIQTLEYLAKLLKDKNIEVEKISIITNGTVLSDRLVRVLKEFKDMSQLDLRISTNVFHNLEVEKRGLTVIRAQNMRTLFAEEIGYHEYGKEEGSPINEGLYKRGRAKYLTAERLDEINKVAKRKYVVMPNSEEEDIYQIDIHGNGIYGQLCISYDGFLVPYSGSFEDEDKFAYNHGINILELPISIAAGEFTIAQFKGKRRMFIF